MSPAIVMPAADAMPLNVAVVQLAPDDDLEGNRVRMVEAVESAAAAGADLVVLPEYAQFFHRNMAEHALHAAEAIDGPFVTAMQEAARVAGVVAVAGFVESGDDGEHSGAVQNTVVAVDGTSLLAVYRKVHLYDAFGIRESDWLRPGALDQEPVFTLAGQRIGIETCYDLRFPEISRRLVELGADVLLVPAEWVRGPQKEHHWRTLLTARAIENTVHVVAADHAPSVGEGCSMIVDPMGITLASLGEQEGIAHAVLDPARTVDVRTKNPSLANRRYRILGDTADVTPA